MKSSINRCIVPIWVLIFQSFSASYLLSFRRIQPHQLPLLDGYKDRKKHRRHHFQLQLSAESKLIQGQELVLIERIEKSKEILHFELFKKTWLLPFSNKLPPFMRSKPVAKAGIRTYSSNTAKMDEVIKQNFESMQNEVEDGIKVGPVGIFVYMWVEENLRGFDVGNFLLNLAVERCRIMNYKYMLLVHDDNGSGKLVKYYTDRGFIPIFDFIEKGMICKL